MAHIGYLSHELVISPAAIANTVQQLAAGPQPVPRLADHLADRLQQMVQPAGLGVVVRVEHLCPGALDAPATIERPRSPPRCGRVRDDRGLRSEFLSLTTSAA